MTTNPAPSNSATPYTINVQAEALPAIRHRFGLFARRCVKLNMVEPILIEGAHSFVPDTSNASRRTNPALLPLIEMVAQVLVSLAPLIEVVIMVAGIFRALAKLENSFLRQDAKLDYGCHVKAMSRIMWMLERDTETVLRAYREDAAHRE